MIRTPLCELFGIDVPIILAPMGSCTSPEFAAAVSNAGGLGSIGTHSRATGPVKPVLPRRQGCAAKVPGGMLLLMAKGVTEKIEAKLTYRVKYSTKDGPRQTSGAYIVSLFP